MLLSRLLLSRPSPVGGNRMMSGIATVLRYAEYGDPLQVIKCSEEPIPVPGDSEVLVKMLLAPINPADINTIQGKYPDKPTLPAIPGNECVGEIVAIGSAVPASASLQIGDRIIPGTTQTGTWRTHSLLPAASVQRMPADLHPVAAATLTVNPPTAYRMLRDFVRLQQGDTVIQNGGNSAVGQAVAQLCRIWGLNCVSVVRDRPDIAELKAFLCAMGATAVLTEAEVRTTELFRSGLPRPRLALNCVGGKSATEILRHLANGGELITYGAMSRESVAAPNAALIFKDIAFRGFWMSRWGRENSHQSAVRREMMAELIGWYLDGQLQVPVHECVPFAEWQRALQESMDFKGFSGKKYILEF